MYQWIQAAMEMRNLGNMRQATGLGECASQQVSGNLPHQQKRNIFHWIYLVYCIHKLKKIKAEFLWNMAILWHSWVIFQLLWCGVQVSQPVYPLLCLWQQVLQEWLILSLARLQTICWYTRSWRNWTCHCSDDSTHSVRSMKGGFQVLTDLLCLIWPMIIAMQKRFRIFNLLIQDPSVTWNGSTLPNG